MAVNIGHEVRNPMTTIRGYLQLLQGDSKYAEHIGRFDTMIEELDRANSILTDFLSLAKNKAIDLKKTSLNSIVTKLFPLLETEVLKTGQNIRVELNNIPEIMLDEKEICQLLLNLAKNALEATASGDVITIRTGLVDRRVFLSVQDTGHGISKEISDRLGTPFLTTKDTGTGLGLPICYGIAARHQASIDYESSARGTTFFVYFPIPS